jgi:hypothetical protein
LFLLSVERLSFLCGLADCLLPAGWVDCPLRLAGWGSLPEDSIRRDCQAG